MAPNLTGIASADLSGAYGGKQLTDQVQGETEEERKKRLKALQQQTGGITSTGSGSALGGLARNALFGTYGQ